MRTPLDRAREMLAEQAARGPIRPLYWRLSPDVRDALLPSVSTEDGTIIARALAMTFGGHETKYGDRLLGLPVVAETALPPNSMILEEHFPYMQNSVVVRVDGEPDGWYDD